MSRTVKRQSVVAFGLSFLDVLCCGLGAAVLLLLVVKHGETVAEIDAAGFLIEHVTAIQELIATKSEEKTELERVADETQRQIIALTAQDDARSSISRLQSTRLAKLLREVQQQRIALNSARQVLAADAANHQRLAEEAQQVSSQQHLTGLMVDSDRVVVLLDSSASMLSSNLVEIIRLRVSNPQIQLSAEKWVSARGAAKWVIERMPIGASYEILTYSDVVRDSQGNLVTTAQAPQWQTKQDADSASTHVDSLLKDLIPLGATDLRTALTAVTAIKPTPSQVIVITDGYPTLPGKAALNRLRGCPRAKSGQVPLISPSCRRSIFDHALRVNRKDLRGIRIDVVLYPLEGDSNAVFGYWELANLYGGRLLSPVPGWPTS
ncbi:MAG: VWA domain-containing protein [Gammaproteobacteria bacterium]|nr:VWA domain-containing protein [Gammaproteobacteria bacterium]